MVLPPQQHDGCASSLCDSWRGRAGDDDDSSRRLLLMVPEARRRRGDEPLARADLSAISMAPGDCWGAVAAAARVLRPAEAFRSRLDAK